jgi:hypothetical protein
MCIGFLRYMYDTDASCLVYHNLHFQTHEQQHKRSKSLSMDMYLNSVAD